MRTLFAFVKKEWMSQIRSFRILLLGLIFVLLGVMNPAIAKITPWLMETMSEALAESGMMIAGVEVDALTSWTQFYKNIPIGLIVFVLFQSSIFTKEYQSGTLIMALTKGLERYKVVIAKTIVPLVMWTCYYWMCFGITYGGNAIFWDNSIAENLLFSVFCWWLFGIWTIMVMVIGSTMTNSTLLVLAITGGTVFAIYLIGLFPKLTKFLPVMLLESGPLIYGAEEVQGYAAAVIITVFVSLISFVGSILLLNKKYI